MKNNVPARGLVLGLMSGTSCDGLTICAVQPNPFQIKAFQNYPYPKALQQRLLHAVDLRAPQLSSLHFELGQRYARLVQRFLKEHKLSQTAILCAGMHGQTVYHGPQNPVPNTLQIAEPAFLAELLGRPVVSQFRTRDMALGGQGAPLIPFFDEYIFGQGTPKILLNLGGIANLSVVGKQVKTFGFDCGPANTLMDLACVQFLNKPYDKNGAVAARGQADEARVRRLLKQKFFHQKPPKSLDKNAFGAAYLHRYFGDIPSAPDLLATLNLFTAAAVAQSVRLFIPVKCQKEIIVSGGGAFNATLLQNIKRLTGLPVCTSAQRGIDPQAKEAAAFALMAWRAWQGKSNHCARATGARKNTILGQMTL